MTADGNPVTATNPAVGTVSVDAAGTITFTPTQDYHGAVRFAYEATTARPPRRPRSSAR